MNEVDPAYLGYWSKEEVVVFLKSLLAQERIGTKAFADIGQAASLRIADLILESELDQGRICILLQKELTKRGTTISARHRGRANGRCAKVSLEQAVASAQSNQTALVQTIEDAILNIFDAELNAHLMRILQLHRKQIEQLNTLLA